MSLFNGSLLNGSVATPDQLRALALVNYGHYTSIRVDDGRARGLSLHLERLAADCRQLFDAELEIETIRPWLRQVAAGHATDPVIVRVTVFDPDLDLARPSISHAPSVLVTSRPAPPTHPAPLAVASTTYRRDLPEIKHIGLMGPLWRRRQAQRRGFDDALFIDEDGAVCEGVSWNIGFFDGDRVIWPTAPALPGVTMRLLTRAHHRTTRRTVRLTEVPTLQAAFATSTSGLRPVTAIDHHPFPIDHPIIATLREEYRQIPPETL